MSNPQRVARIQALHDVGAKIDDGLEQIKLQTARRDGVRSGQLDAINHLIANCKDPSLDKNTVHHCLKSLQQLQTQSNIMYYMSLGSEKQCESHVAEIKKMYDLEVALKLREETLPTPEEMASRPVPPRTIKEVRLAEATLTASGSQEKSPEPQGSKEIKIKETDPEAPVSPSKELSASEAPSKPPEDNRKKKPTKAPMGESAIKPSSAMPPKKETRKKRKIKSSS